MPRALSGWIAVALALSLASCAEARAPDYKEPTVRLVDPAQLAHRDALPYRTLMRADFRATAPPGDDALGAEHMSAYTCANVIPKGALLLEAQQAVPGGPFTARPQPIELIAVMDRDCSWWNPDQRGDQQAYVLQHEQIHFAITEATARELTRRIGALRATGDSAEAAAAALQRRIDGVSRDVTRAMTERHSDFDRDTSGRHEPALQQRWYDRLRTELQR
jgi:hypothetical protein